MELETLSWPVGVIEIDEVKAWINVHHPYHPGVVGPTIIYAAKDNFGVTARFEIYRQNDPIRLDDIVYKANVYSGFARAGFVFDFVSRYCTGRVPTVIAWTDEDEKSSILFECFSGKSVREEGSLDALLKMGRTVAQIQLQIASAPSAEKHKLPQLSISEIPHLFSSFAANIQTVYRNAWTTDTGTLSGLLKFRAQEVPDRLEMLKSEIAAWSAELDDGNWPASIFHGDLHGENAIVKSDGSVLIYDWEDISLTCPFLSMDRLLVEAWRVDTHAQAAPWGYYAGTPGQMLIKNAYLNELTWKTPVERERACNLATCLAVIKEAWSEQKWAEAMEIMDGNAEWTAQLIHRLYEHRKALH